MNFPESSHKKKRSTRTSRTINRFITIRSFIILTMWTNRILAVALTSFSTMSCVSAFARQTCRTTLATIPLFSSSSDTPDKLPEFASKEDYLAYMKTVSALPKGFAVGTAKGTFVSVEAPLLGPLPIRGTVIQLTEGATENWAACYTKNKFPGAPIIVGKSRRTEGKPVHALVM